MVMTVEDDVRAVLVERLPERFSVNAVAMLPGTETRRVPVGQSTDIRVRRQISPQPLFLCRARRLVDLTVEGNNMPGTQVIRIVALGSVARCCTEIIEIATCAGSMIVMIPRNRLGAVFMPSPVRRIAIIKLGQGPILVDIIAEGENSPGNRVE